MGICLSGVGVLTNACHSSQVGGHSDWHSVERRFIPECSHTNRYVRSSNESPIVSDDYDEPTSKLIARATILRGWLASKAKLCEPALPH